MSNSLMEMEDVETESSADELQRPLERWAPLGANAVDECESPEESLLEYSYGSEAERLRHLEEEQEQLNSSLLALTTHFAQVQFRLKQIVDAPPNEKEVLLKDLEEFAFRGIPDIRSCKLVDFQDTTELDEKQHEEKINEQRVKQRELIEQLKDQLEELERYAYETGDADLPQSIVLEKQKVIIDELKGKIPLNLEEFHALSPEELRRQVDNAINQLVNPVKMKEQLVSQLKTQITDLERFIEFLQGEASPSHDKHCNCACSCPVHGHRPKLRVDNSSCKSDHYNKNAKRKRQMEQEEEMRKKTTTVIKKALTLMQMFILTQLGCGANRQFYKNTLKQTSKGNHWGDLRARLEIAIEKVLEIASKQEQPVDSDYTSDSEENCTIICNEELTSAVRKDLSMTIRDLLQHGLMPIGQSTSLVPFIGCFSTRSSAAGILMHPWELILKYYELKHGEQYNATPARRLSQSFNLEIVGGQAITAKQTLLGIINTVISSHTPFKRNNDSHFKAFICASLNQKKTTTWIRLILRTRTLTDQYFQPWSYVSKTGFEDAFRSLERLYQINFDLPVDLAVRPFQNIKDVF